MLNQSAIGKMYGVNTLPVTYEVLSVLSGSFADSLNKEILSIFIIISLVFISNLRAEDEPVDIWDFQ